MKDQFFNRDLSWIEFNARILSEGCRNDIPCIERLKFLSIVSTNFDEFFQVRVASIKRQQKKSPLTKDISGLSFKQILQKISDRCHQITDIQYEVLNKEIFPSLSKANLNYITPENYNSQQLSYTQNLFQKEIFPLLTPLRTDLINFPTIVNQKVYAAFLLTPIPGIKEESSVIKTSDKMTVSLVQIPSNINRLIYLPTIGTGKNFTILDDIICKYGTQLFPGYNVTESMLFSVSRDADFGVNEEAGNQFIEAMEEVLAQRQNSFAVRMVCNNKSKILKDFLTKKLNLSANDIYTVDGLIHPEVLIKVEEVEESQPINSKKWKNFYPTELNPNEPMWDKLKTKDLLLHLPYESFDPVIKFISDAADDQNVLAIKITLYRTETNSAIVNALEKAAQNGKQVTAFIELKARFDEQRNIEWATRLEKAGVIVIYGIVNLKVHGKTMIIIRKEEDSIKRYVHISTGNYNANTAKIYSDLSFFTSKQEIANDVTLFFNLITGYSALQPMKNIYLAPINLKSQLLQMIEREIKLSTPQNPGLIIAKMNSLGHEEIIKALYKASKAGVKIQINCRGLCQLIPQKENLSENIKVVSIIGRYLEHSRIFYFQNGGQEELYLSSADWLNRNLDRRIELMFPITDSSIFQQIKKILLTYFKDNNHSYVLNSDGTWKQNFPQKGEKSFSAQEELYEEYKKRKELSEKDPKIEFQIRRK